MKKLLLALLLVAATVQPAIAQDYVEIVRNTRGDRWLSDTRPNRIWSRRSDVLGVDQTTLWVVQENKRPVMGVSRVLLRYTADCHNNVLGLSQFINQDRNRNVIRSVGSTSSAPSWQPIQPNSIGSAIWEYACQWNR